MLKDFIKASKLAKDTGIAQSTISKIVNNATSQIDYSTLDKICLYLKIGSVFLLFNLNYNVEKLLYFLFY
ncbi:helix-turn-helix domain-containing protein [Lactococcus cremoris]|uniref:helix-turn-helix domain-containing protein n=1 Tax=Lactococcus lactis subsp. cremoris TaxID=1359 RepID=UPI000AC217A5|nr:helix-turn-helix transcriptional regulator [Lactococcus cremoris]